MCPRALRCTTLPGADDVVAFSLWTDTMNRCFHLFSRTLASNLFGVALVLCAGGALLPAPAQAQVGLRNFHGSVERGQMKVTAPPQVLMNGKPDQLGAGARILGTQNTIVSASSLAGQEVTVNYLRDSSGLIFRVWVLTQQEAAQPTPRQVSDAHMRAAQQNGRGTLGARPASGEPAFNYPN